VKALQSQVLLTFDIEGPAPIEDFFNDVAVDCLRTTLDLLDDKDVRGFFFITGSAAEKLCEYPDLVRQLSRHEIGYHSSSHSIRPRIVEYTDVRNYDEAVSISLKRETSHVDGNGRIKGEGGILALREVFPRKDIICFRAPFLAWTPPHLEALRKLGIKFDFSASIANCPISFRGVTFYPFPIPIDDCLLATFVRREPNRVFPTPILGMLLRRRVTVFFMHPTNLRVGNAFGDRDMCQIAGNVRTKINISLLQLLLERMLILQRLNLIEISSSLSRNWRSLHLEETDIERIYWQSVRSQIDLFGYSPRFILSHFRRFFGQGSSYGSEMGSLF